MLDKELLAKIKQLQIYTSHAVSASFAGQYESVFKGRGMQFEDVREYVAGDDVRDIDWNVTAREGKAYVKRFVEEREMTVILAVDMSGSENFGTSGKFKKELAAELCAVLAFAASRNNDKVGLLIFTNKIELFVPPKKGDKHVLRIIRELLGFEEKGIATDIPQALDYIARITNKRATIFVVSDFISDKDFLKPMKLLKRRNDVVAVTVRDTSETNLPSCGIVEFKDPESGELFCIDCSNKKTRRQFELMNANRFAALNDSFKSSKIDCIDVVTDQPYIHTLIKFFNLRRKRR
ncbi:MAG: DUF58 domain-containing protein [Sedimentisphaeraceae bacterium JB056]